MNEQMGRLSADQPREPRGFQSIEELWPVKKLTCTENGNTQNQSRQAFGEADSPVQTLVVTGYIRQIAQGGSIRPSVSDRLDCSSLFVRCLARRIYRECRL